MCLDLERAYVNKIVGFKPSLTLVSQKICAFCKLVVKSSKNVKYNILYFYFQGQAEH